MSADFVLFIDKIYFVNKQAFMNQYKILENEELGALSSPFRRQLLEDLSEQAESAVSISRRYEMSRQRVGYHMRDLERAGFIEVSEERQQRGLKERLYRAKPVVYVNKVRDVPTSSQDRFSWANLLNSFAQGLWELTTIRRLADKQGKKLATLGIEGEIHFQTPAARKAFTQELVREVERLIEKYDKPEVTGSRPFKLLVGAFPAVQLNQLT
jgi:DNA-binding transcriptional ArsR family regulator